MGYSATSASAALSPLDYEYPVQRVRQRTLLTRVAERFGHLRSEALDALTRALPADSSRAGAKRVIFAIVSVRHTKLVLYKRTVCGTYFVYDTNTKIAFFSPFCPKRPFHSFIHFIKNYCTRLL